MDRKPKRGHWCKIEQAGSCIHYTYTDCICIGVDGVVTGEYGYLTADGVYRTTVYTSSHKTGFVVLAQTEEERRVKMEKESEEELYSTTPVRTAW